jgi:hypothetical protein
MQFQQCLCAIQQALGAQVLVRASQCDLQQAERGWNRGACGEGRETEIPRHERGVRCQSANTCTVEGAEHPDNQALVVFIRRCRCCPMYVLQPLGLVSAMQDILVGGGFRNPLIREAENA